MKRLETTQSYLERKIGSVSIDADSLVDLIRRIGPDAPIKAISNQYVFEGLDDITKNLATFAGNPRLEIGKNAIIFKEGRCEVTNNWRGDQDRDIVDSFANEIRRHKNIIDYWRDYNFYVALILAIIFGSTPFGSKIFQFRYFSNDIVNSMISYFFYLSSFMTLHQIFFLQKRNSVRYRISEPFLQRHFETIVTGIVGPIIGAFFGYWLSTVANAPAP